LFFHSFSLLFSIKSQCNICAKKGKANIEIIRYFLSSIGDKYSLCHLIETKKIKLASIKGKSFWHISCILIKLKKDMLRGYI